MLEFVYNGDNSYLFVNGKKIYKFKANNKNVNFPSQFCVGSMSNKFDYAKSGEVSLKENVYDFSVDYNVIDKSNTLNIHKYSMVRSNMKLCFGLLIKCYCIIEF